MYNNITLALSNINTCSLDAGVKSCKSSVALNLNSSSYVVILSETLHFNIGRIKILRSISRRFVSYFLVIFEHIIYMYLAFDAQLFPRDYCCL